VFSDFINPLYSTAIKYK